ncbi:MAG: hypothetical protein Kow0077_15740 [Anaerolineae bacterium]
MTNEEIILAMTEAISAGDVEEALSYFAENAFFIGYWMGELNASVGQDEIRALFEGLAAGDFHIESEVVDTFGDGSILLTDTHTSGAGMPPQVQPLHLYDMYLLKDGKIQVYTYYMSQESVDALMEVMAAMAPAPITAEEIVGTWRWRYSDFYFQFRADGTFRASDNIASDLNSDTPQDLGTYTVEDGVLYLKSSPNSRYCREEAEAAYALSWSEDDELQLTVEFDNCDARHPPSDNPQPFRRYAEGS